MPHTKVCKNDLFSALISRQYYEDKSPVSSIVSSGYRPLIRKLYKRATGNSRKVFKTRLGAGQEINPVYDIQYSPVAYPDHRVIAVGDEFGYLSLVKVGFEGKGGHKDVKERVWNRGAQSVPPIAPQNDDAFENEGDNSLNPVLYSVAWNNQGNKILTGYGDGSVKIWDVEKSSRPTCVTAIPAFDKSLKRVAWCQETLISCSRTNEILVHDHRMRIPLTNRIDCNQMSAKLTDICVLGDNYVLASSSNQSSVFLFDLRYTYKLYKRIKPVESFDVYSPGYPCLKYDNLVDDGVVYALGSDSVVRSFDYRSGATLASYQVPDGVDFFTKIDVDRVSGVLVSGGCEESAWGFDLFSGWEKGVRGEPFFELREGKRVVVGDEEDGEEDDKENVPDGGVGRCSSAVALGGRRGFSDCCFQMACGGDNSSVIVYD